LYDSIKEAGYETIDADVEMHKVCDEAGVIRHTREPYSLPTLRIKQHSNDEPSAVVKPQYWHPEDFIIENYQSHPVIKAPLSN
jgi:thymidylate synthase